MAADAPALGAIDRAVETTPLRLGFYLALVLLATAGLMAVPRNGGNTLDWQFFQFFDEVARRTLLHYHQLPLWNPYTCGGITNIGNPQTTFLTPTFPLVMIFGTTFGMRLSQIVIIVVCCEGGYRLMRELGVGPSAALLGSVAYPMYWRTFVWIGEGQYANLGGALAMWIIFCYLRGMKRPIYLALGGAIFAWLVSFRGIAMGPHLAMALGLWSLLEARRRWIDTRSLRAALWPLGACAALGLLTFGFAAPRMMPVFQTLLGAPRVQPESAVRNLSEIFVEIFVIPPGTKGYGAAGHVYIGLATYLLFLGALLFATPRRRAAIPLLICFWFILLCLGYQGQFSPYPLTKHVPLLASLRNPTNYSFAAALFLVIAASLTLDELQRWFFRRETGAARVWAKTIFRWMGRVLPIVVALSTALELGVRARAETASKSWTPFTFAPVPRVDQEFRQTRGNRFVMPLWPYLDRGMLSCYDETPWPASADLRPDLPAEEYLADPAAGLVERREWTPNRIDLTVELSRPSTVLVNQNWNRGWRSSTGTVRSANGLLAVDLPAGHHELRLRYLPSAFLAGIFTLLLALAATVFLWRRDRRRPQ